MKKSRKVGVSNTEVGWNIHIHTNTNTQIEYTKMLIPKMQINKTRCCHDGGREVTGGGRPLCHPIPMGISILSSSSS